MKKLVLLSIIIAVSACTPNKNASVKPGTSVNDLRIDASSKENMGTSLKSIYSQLNNKEVCELKAAFFNIQIGDKQKQEQTTGNKDASATPLGPKIHGMNYNEIMALSKTYPAYVQPVCRN